MSVTDLGSRTCPRCDTPARIKRIDTGGTGTKPVTLSRCLCDARRCQHCKSYTTNPAATHCVHCKKQL